MIHPEFEVTAGGPRFFGPIPQWSLGPPFIPWKYLFFMASLGHSLQEVTILCLYIYMYEYVYVHNIIP